MRDHFLQIGRLAGFRESGADRGTGQYTAANPVARLLLRRYGIDDAYDFAPDDLVVGQLTAALEARARERQNGRRIDPGGLLFSL
jgi:hypothetical protein